jgi:hypothetical protein
MPIHDAPAWAMDKRVVAHVSHHAPFVREHMRGIMQGLDEGGVNWHDVQSFGAEVAAGLVNLLADRLQKHRVEVSPERSATMSDSDFLQFMVHDITTRALLRRVRGDD